MHDGLNFVAITFFYSPFICLSGWLAESYQSLMSNMEERGTFGMTEFSVLNINFTPYSTGPMFTKLKIWKKIKLRFRIFIRNAKRITLFTMYIHVHAKHTSW